MREHRFQVALIEYEATIAHVVNLREHRFDVTLIEYVATLAHVVNVREHRFQVICSDGAKALKAVTGKIFCSKQFKYTEVSHKKQQFVIKNESSSTTALWSQAPSTLTSHGKF
jgi:translation initiation factor IF-1